MPLQFQHWLFLCGCSVGLQHDVSLSPCCLHHFSTVLHTVALLHDVSFSTAMGIIFFSRWNCEHILSSFSFTFLKDILPSTLRERRKRTIYTVWKEMGYANINTTTSNHACTQMLIQMWIPMKLGEKTCSSDQLEWVVPQKQQHLPGMQYEVTCSFSQKCREGGVGKKPVERIYYGPGSLYRPWQTSGHEYTAIISDLID